MNAQTKLPPVLSLALDDIILDAELQPRAALDRATWEEYLYLLGDGVDLPAVTVFRDGTNYWLADGYHRWHAHKAFGAATIKADVRSGARDDALRFSLSANATHGRRREAGDYQKAYETACRHGFVKPEDTDSVQAIIRCSMRTAYDLTLAARAKIEAERDAEIAEKKAQGKSNRQIARETGVDERTVRRTAAELQSAKTPHPGELPLEQPASKPHPFVAEVNDMVSDRGERWWQAFRALEAIGAAASVDDLMADPYPGIDHVFDPALEHAQRWINELHRRYFNGN